MGPRRALRLAIAAYLFVSCCCETEPQWRSLSEVTYHFTTCNATGMNGSSYESCLSYYQSVNSPIQKYLTSDSNTLGFFGGQTFTFPRSGTYNVTIAGASGGRGLCNTKKSRGVVLKTQLAIKKGVNDSVLVLVGQKGTGPCDTNSTHNLCRSPPTNVTEADNCLTQWNNEMVSSTLKNRVGGGGGGGGSMIWPKNSTGHFTQPLLPFIAAAGGGGTSLGTNYGTILSIQGTDVNRLRVGNETDEELYQRFVDGRPSYVDVLTNNIGGGIGTRPVLRGDSMNIVAGAGAGWYYPDNVEAIEDLDGQPLSRSEDFAQGGLDCVVGIDNQNYGNLPFKRIDGGFGGGGGGCDEGGGGGGFGGGDVIGQGLNIPGGGGYSLLTLNNAPMNSTSAGMNHGDGFVTIIPSDCHCTHGCTIIGDMYQCTCIEPAILANNGLDCISTDSNYTYYRVTEKDSYTLTVSGVSFSYSLLQFPTVWTLYEAVVTFESKREGGGGGGAGRRKRETEESTRPLECLIVWLNVSTVPVLISDSSNGSLRFVTDLANGSVSESQYALSDGVMISGGIILGNCTVPSIELSSSTTTGGTVNISAIDVVSNYSNFFQSIVANMLLPSSTSPPSSSLLPSQSMGSSSIFQVSTSLPTVSSTMSTGTTRPIASPFSSTLIIIIAVVGGASIMLIVGVLVLVMVCIIKRQRKTLKVYKIYNSSMMLNNAPEKRQLEKLRFRLASLKRNPNYGVSDGPEDDIDYSSKSKLNSQRENSDSENGYTPMTFESHDFESSVEQKPQPYRLRSRSARRKTFTLRPKFGVMSPTVSFYEYNKDRADNDWEHDRTQLTYLRDIGEGQFGKVLLMKAKNIAGYKGKLPVAVKTLSSIEDEDVQKFLEEIELMKKFSNPHIVSLLGVSTQSSEGAPLMILEYMPYGDLHSFLLKHKPKPGEHAIIGIYHQIRFAGDIANAMSFLESNKYVHRDVAARNCLVGPNLEVKVADFGMARVVQEKDYYRIAGRAVLPVRWMAPESLIYGIFSSASDVWSYGVLLWEIATYGTVPLESCSVQEIVEMAQQKILNHSWPEDYLPELKMVQDECHKYEPEERLSFENIASLLLSSKTATS